MKTLYKEGGKMYAEGGDLELPYGPRRRSKIEQDQRLFEKGVEAELRQDMRRENRMANRQGRRTGVFPARPSDMSFLLEALEQDRLNRPDMVRKGGRNEMGRGLARFGAGAGLMSGLAAYQNTPKQISRPLGAHGQYRDIDLNSLQRIGMMLGLGPY
tara:strand:- start:428 stop:898 length:471 start_codon:yes stop_codon:yes gene_type:complete